MASERDRLQARLQTAGWNVTGRYTTEVAGWYIVGEEWHLESRLPPAGRSVILEVRYPDNFWFEEHILGIRIHLPRSSTSASALEVYLDQEEIRAGPFRQVLRVLEWFRDPVSGTFWEEAPQPGDWMPPPNWENAAVPFGGLEQRWPISTDPLDMVCHLPDRGDQRRLRLFACACCRQVTRWMEEERNDLAVVAAERYAEGLVPRREMKKACKHSDLAWLAFHDGKDLATHAIRSTATYLAPARAAHLLRDIFGNPFHPVALRRTWLREAGGAARLLAEHIVAEQRFEELPILADALEDAGCTHTELLGHLRSPGPHVRGCWVLDLLNDRDQDPVPRGRA